jgi:predicted nucleic acid-binding protein
VFIYQLEANERYVALTHYIFEWLEGSGHAAITSTITMTELLLQPYRLQNRQLLDEYYGLLSRYTHLDWIPPDLKVADIAAQLRARYKLKTPDAVQAATAVYGRATAFITNDAVFKRVAELQVVVLEELI